jgi:hypothetical protein
MDWRANRCGLRHLTPFARVGAVAALTVEDYFSQKKRWWLRLHEKNGKLNEMPRHHKLEECLDAYLKAAGIAGDRKRPLFRSAIGKTGQLSARPVLRGGSGAWCAAVLPMRELQPR